MKRREKTQPQYKPEVVLAKLHTAKTYDEVFQIAKGQGYSKNEIKSIVRSYQYFDGLTVYLSKWNWDNHENWHLYNWQTKDDETVKCAMYEAEQYHPDKLNRYKNNFEKFCKDWDAETYEPGMTYTFNEEDVEVLEVVQEEENNIDPEQVKKEIKRAEDAQQEKRQRRRMRAARGARYGKKYF
jgi:hypothetical protein